jgi:hypothetical protein
MIKDRLYIPSDDELIYHYCGPEPFPEIIKSRSIWLSASYTLNDVTERSWGYSIFEKAAETLEHETGSEFIEKAAAEPVIAGYLHSMLMIACFSLDADVLSQWRAYGDDGRGFAIGFSPNQLQMPAKQLRVLYDEGLQIQELIGNLKHIYEVEKSRGFKYGDEFQSHLFHMGGDLCAYKNPAFREEREIRLAHLCGLVPEGKSKKIVALGARGPDGERLSEPLKTHFRMRKGVLVPYVIADYSNNGAAAPIKEIVLGPRNENAESNIEIFLNTIGVRDVTVRRSTAPYQP